MSKISHDKVVLHKRYVLKLFIKKWLHFNMYQAIDIQHKCPVIAFIKIAKNAENCKFPFELHQKLEKISARIIWIGEEMIEKIMYKIFIVQKHGPSLKQFAKAMKNKINVKNLFLIFYNILKNLETLHDYNVVYHVLKPSKLYLSKTLGQPNIYFIDYIEVKKFNEKCSKLNSKYTSIGAHLGLNANPKDDLESLSYIMLDLFTQNEYFSKKSPSSSCSDYYLNIKTNPNLQNKLIPEDCIAFYSCVRNLNNSQVFNYDYWKKVFKKDICVVSELKSPDQIHQPEQQIKQSQGIQNQIQLSMEFGKNQESICSKISRITKSNYKLMPVFSDITNDN